LHDREGKLTPGQEAGFLAVDRNQIRLCENLQETLIFEGLNRRAEINVGTEKKQVQNIVDSSGGSGGTACGPLTARGQRLRSKGAELSRGYGADCVSGSRRNEVDAQLRQCCAVYFGKLYLQQNFLGSDRAESQHVHDPWRI